MTVRLMSRDPNNPTSYTIDTGYSFDGSTITVSTVGSYSYQLKMLFEQSDNVESITYNTDGSSPGYYDNNGNWYTLSSTSGTINVSDLSDFDYSRGIAFGRSFSGTYTTSQPTATPVPKIGSNDISKIYLGTEEISKIYLGTEVAYETEVTPPTPTGPVFDLDASIYNTSYGNWSDKDAFLRGENVSLTLSRISSSQDAGLELTCSDWTDVAKIQVNSSGGQWYTSNVGYTDSNDNWHYLTATSSGTTITILIPSNNRNSIKSLWAGTLTHPSDTFSNFTVYDDNDNTIIPAS